MVIAIYIAKANAKALAIAVAIVMALTVATYYYRINYFKNNSYIFSYSLDPKPM
jgi:hypothetical protein